MLYETKKIIGIVINIYNGGDKDDALIKVLSIDSFYFFKAKSFFKKEGKNNKNIFVGSLTEFEYFTKYGNNNHFLLKSANLVAMLDFYKSQNQNLVKKLFYLFQQIEEPNSEIYLTYEKYLKECDDYHRNYLTTFLLVKILKTKGWELVTDRCLKCGTNQNLFCFDINEGGILCFKHKTNKAISNLDSLRAFYNLGNSFEDYKRNSNEKINLELLNIIYHHFFKS